MKPHEIRDMLADTLQKFDSGQISGEHARTKIAIAHQYSHSLAVECKAVKIKLQMGELIGRGDLLRLG